MLLEECELSGVQIKKDTEVKLLSPLKPSSEKSSYLIECSAEGGIKKEISTIATTTLTEGKILISAMFTVAPQDFDIDIPNIVRKKITDKINIHLNYELVEKK
jgi:hypothetical protein